MVFSGGFDCCFTIVIRLPVSVSVSLTMCMFVVPLLFSFSLKFNSLLLPECLEHRQSTNRLLFLLLGRYKKSFAFEKKRKNRRKKKHTQHKTFDDCYAEVNNIRNGYVIHMFQINRIFGHRVVCLIRDHSIVSMLVVGRYITFTFHKHQKRLYSSIKIQFTFILIFE